MEPLVLLLIAILCISAGLVGALMGIGGGLIIIPLLTLGFGIPMQEAIGASLIGVIATSTGAASKYVKQGLTNVRLALFLEMSTTVGSMIGALIAVYTDQMLLFLLFSMLLVYSGVTMLRHRESLVPPEDASCSGPIDLSCSYVDPRERCEVRYGVRGLRKGLAYSGVAGMLSGLLGVGGGLVKVPVMNVCMNVPLKAATATSNFMIGVTALTGAIIFYGHGLLDTYLCAAVALGTFTGAYVGTRAAAHYSTTQLRKWFSILLFIVAFTMVLKAFGLWGGA